MGYGLWDMRQGLRASAAHESYGLCWYYLWYGVPLSTVTARTEAKLEGADQHLPSAAQVAALLAAESQRGRFTSARQLEANNLPWQKGTNFWRPEEVSLSARHTAVDDVLTDQQLYHLAFVENSVERRWDKVTFPDESTFSSASY